MMVGKRRSVTSSVTEIQSCNIRDLGVNLTVMQLKLKLISVGMDSLLMYLQLPSKLTTELIDVAINL
jgi:hypothetical protein